MLMNFRLLCKLAALTLLLISSSLTLAAPSSPSAAALEEWKRMAYSHAYEKLSPEKKKELEDRAIRWMDRYQNEAAIMNEIGTGTSSLLMEPRVLEHASQNIYLQKKLLGCVLTELTFRPPRAQLVPAIEHILSSSSSEKIQHFFSVHFEHLRGVSNRWLALGEPGERLLTAFLNSPALPPSTVKKYYAESSAEHQTLLSRNIFPKLSEERLLSFAGEVPLADALLSRNNPTVITARWVETWLLSSADTESELTRKLSAAKFSPQILRDVSKRYPGKETTDAAQLVKRVRPRLPQAPEEREALRATLLKQGRKELIRYLLCPETLEWTARSVLPNEKWASELELIEYVIRTDRLDIDLKKQIIDEAFLSQPQWKNHPELFAFSDKPQSTDAIFKEFMSGRRYFGDRESCLVPLLRSLHGGSLH